MFSDEFENKNGLNTNFAENRMQICKECPLYSPIHGGICNSKLWLNTETGDISLVRKPGYIQGCNCKLSSKTKNRNSVCPAGKW